MHRFFLPSSSFQGDSVIFPAETTHQIARVLRLGQGDIVAAIDQDRQTGLEYSVKLIGTASTQAVGTITGEIYPKTEPAHSLSIYLGLTQREKFEWMLQKCTEIGVSVFIPMITSRSLVQDDKDYSRKAERWHRILKEAAEQSGRMVIPALEQPMPFQKALNHARENHQVAFIAWEKAKAGPEEFLSPHTGLQDCSRLAVMVGPEGGFSDEEVDLARGYHLHPITLGPRILRMETAAVVATALILQELGDMRREPSRV